MKNETRTSKHWPNHEHLAGLSVLEGPRELKELGEGCSRRVWERCWNRALPYIQALWLDGRRFRGFWLVQRGSHLRVTVPCVSAPLIRKPSSHGKPVRGNVVSFAILYVYFQLSQKLKISGLNCERLTTRLISVNTTCARRTIYWFIKTFCKIYRNESKTN
jgi:hypothetical protein